MDAKIARPYERAGFKHPNLRGWVLDNRGQILAALLTLARAWFDAGCPKPAITPLGSYESWTTVIGGILEHAGVSGFLANRQIMYEQGDIESSQWEQFCLVLYDHFEGGEFLTSTVAGELSSSPSALYDAMPNALSEPKGGSLQHRLGTAFARHAGNPANATQADVTYVRDGRLSAVHGKNVIMACWNMMIPYLCPELPEKQKEALKYGVKVPLVYTAVAIRNWKAFEKLGVHSVACPGMYHYQMNLDVAVDIGGYESPKKPAEPILVRMERTPCLPGLPERDQHRAGRGDLLATPFETFERSIRDQFARVLGEGGFDPANDITAITVNRWPHGYAYEYNYLFDPEWPKGESPCEIGRKRFGRIAIANSDAGAAAYTDQAMDQAWRAVEELHTA